MSKLYVGNLSYETTEQDLRDAFAQFEPVTVSIVMDRDSGRSKGFAFVTCGSDELAKQAQSTSIELGGRLLKIDAARPPTSGGAGRSGGGNFGGGGRSNSFRGGRSDRRDSHDKSSRW